MLYIRPIEDKEKQKEYAERAGVPYIARDLAYAAFVDDAFVGISQFHLTDEYGMIDTIAGAVGTDDLEALFIMGRQTMNWIDLLGIHRCRAANGAGETKLLRVLGFPKPDENGVSEVDTTHLFEGKCGGNCNVKEQLARDGEN